MKTPTIRFSVPPVQTSSNLVNITESSPKLLGVELKVEEISVTEHLVAHPEAAPFLCHRIYDLNRLESSGLKVPSTSIEQGLREHVESLLE